ncbi:hypothetical protein ElyMa_001297500 [Elysia marginata]|uniref:SCP domain-containing protein n=1 Tax=Elysia marginata TaxID=1093978 RepID=A0AAV4IKN6_9GAST|nr:hypothetical protein ElyMa_001297500 [Elysia marginata]
MFAFRMDLLNRIFTTYIYNMTYLLSNFHQIDQNNRTVEQAVRQGIRDRKQAVFSQDFTPQDKMMTRAEAWKSARGRHSPGNSILKHANPGLGWSSLGLHYIRAP